MCSSAKTRPRCWPAYLTAHGLVVPTPRKRPRSSYIRFQAELPNETWQTDFTHYRLADNGMVFTARLSGGRGGRNALEHELRRLHVNQKNAAPNHPTTCGKVERFQQTMKNWAPRATGPQPR